MQVKEVKCKTILSKCGIEGLDYSINPYTGCMHGCNYCYADFITMWNPRKEPWGQFVDVKINAPKVLAKELKTKKKGVVWLSSVTDAY